MSVLENVPKIKSRSTTPDFLYNGKENIEELDFNMLEYGFRLYDPAIGRFPSVDPIADNFAFVSGFNYAENSPITNIDLWGLQKFNDLGGHLDHTNQQPVETSGDTEMLNVAEDLSMLYEVLGTAAANLTGETAHWEDMVYARDELGATSVEDMAMYAFWREKIRNGGLETGASTWGGGRNFRKTKSNTSRTKWVDESGNIKWPKNDGFAGTPETITLEKGTVIDRYGGTTGKYASPKGTPIEQRSLPQGSENRGLNTYEVTKPIKGVQSGKAAPWFDQPGGGTQFKFNKSIQTLIDEGYLKPTE